MVQGLQCPAGGKLNNAGPCLCGPYFVAA